MVDILGLLKDLHEEAFGFPNAFPADLADRSKDTIALLEHAEIVGVRLMDAADGDHCSCPNSGSFDVARDCGHLRVPHFARHGTMIVWPEGGA